MAIPSFTMPSALRGWRSFRPSHLSLEPEDEGLHLSAPVTACTSSISSRPCRCLARGLQAIRDVAAGGGNVLFVGTKRQAQEAVSELGQALRGQYYVDHRWLGGMLTNFKTISGSIKRLRELDESRQPAPRAASPSASYSN